MSALFKVMLATDAELDKLRFPLLASPKLDGIRAYVRDGVVYSRSNKPIPNKWVQGQFKHLEHLDGELIVGSPTSHTVYRDTVSHVMARDKENFAITFYAFDYVRDLDDRFQNRLVYITKYTGPVIVTLHQEVIHSLDSLLSYEEAMLNHGYEGLILRDPDAPYKMGRSTVKEGYLLKLKRFVDAEAVVIGFEERMHNGNEATVSELGRTKRSSHKAGKSGRGDLGAITARTPDGVEFSIGTGFTDADRAALWADRGSLIGRIAKYKYFPVGVKEAPRHPVFLGWRVKEDM